MLSSLAERGVLWISRLHRPGCKENGHRILLFTMDSCNTEAGQAESAGETRIRLQVVTDLEALGKRAPKATWRR